MSHANERCPPWVWADVPPLEWQRAITDASAQGSCGQLRRLAKFDAAAVAAAAAEYWPDPLGLTCHYGHLDAARWIVATSGISARAVSSVCGGSLLRSACGNGHLPVVQWLAATFSLPVVEVHSALRVACIDGHLNVARWLVAEFGLLAIDARAGNDHALRMACRNGHLRVVAWMINWFALSAEDVRNVAWKCLWDACAGGHLEVAQWLVGQFELTAKDTGACALAAARKNGHAEVARWLVDDFGVDGASPDVAAWMALKWLS